MGARLRHCEGPEPAPAAFTATGFAVLTGKESRCAARVLWLRPVRTAQSGGVFRIGILPQRKMPAIHGRHRCAALSARLCSAAEVAVKAAGTGSGPSQWRSRAKSEGVGRKGRFGRVRFVRCWCVSCVRETDCADEHAGLCTLAEVTFATRRVTRATSACRCVHPLTRLAMPCPFRNG